MQYLLKRLKLPKSAEISENYDHSKSNYVRGSNNCVLVVSPETVTFSRPQVQNTNFFSGDFSSL